METANESKLPAKTRPVTLEFVSTVKGNVRRFELSEDDHAGGPWGTQGFQRMVPQAGG